MLLNKKLTTIFILFWNLCFTLFDSYAQKDVKCLERDFFEISLLISSIPELEKYFFQYEPDLDRSFFPNHIMGQKSLFISCLPDIVRNYDSIFDLNIQDNKVYFWFDKHLFFFNIEYWFEYVKFEIVENRAYIAFRTYNSPDTLGKRKKIKGDLILKKKADLWVLKDLRYTEW